MEVSRKDSWSELQDFIRQAGSCHRALVLKEAGWCGS